MKSFLGNLLLYINNYIISFIPSYTIRYAFYKYLMKFKIGKNAAIHMGVKFLCRSHFEIGENSVINQSCILDNRGGIKIGKNVTVGHNVKLITTDHIIHSDNFEGRSREIKLNDFVFIGTAAIVLGGVHMKKGSILGAGGVLTKSTRNNAIHTGIPAIEIGIRNSSLQYTQNYKRLFF